MFVVCLLLLEWEREREGHFPPQLHCILEQLQIVNKQKINKNDELLTIKLNKTKRYPHQRKDPPSRPIDDS